MKDVLTRLAWPLLKFFETDEGSEHYKPSHRVILSIVGSLFLVLAALSLAAGLFSGQISAAVPVVVFFAVGSLALMIAGLGSNAAVAKIWGVKR